MQESWMGMGPMQFRGWFVLVVVCFSGGCGRTDHTANLMEFTGRDLRELDEKGKCRLETALARCVRERHQRNGIHVAPWFLWPHRFADGHQGYIGLIGHRLLRIPGRSFCSIQFLAFDGRPTTEFAFSTGWRINIESAIYKIDTTLGIPLIELATLPSVNGNDVCRQVYGVFDDRVALLRAENNAGCLVGNDYHHPNHTIGPPVPKATAEEWELVLRGGSQARVLEALTWIGGMHRDDLTPFPSDMCLEASESVRLAAEIRQRPGVRHAVWALFQSENRWVREAAAAVIQQIAEELPLPGDDVLSGTALHQEAWDGGK